MRLFLALFPPPDCQARIARRVRRRAPKLPRARWVPEERIHLTLVFLGEIDREIESLRAALSEVARSRQPFRLKLSGCGTFPNRGKARVAWVGLLPSEELADLAAATASACSEGADSESGRPPFQPHLTVARCRQPWDRRTAQAWSDSSWSDHPRFEVPYFDLMESRLGSSGSTYRVVERFELKA